MYEEIMLYHSDEAAFQYIKSKKDHPDGCLHEKYGSRIRKAYKGEKWFPDFRIKCGNTCIISLIIQLYFLIVHLTHFCRYFRMYWNRVYLY